MRVGFDTGNLVALANGRQVGVAAGGSDLTSLASAHAAKQMGIRNGVLPGSYQPIYEQAAKVIEEEITETRDVIRRDAIYEDRAITDTRAIFAEQAVYEEREIRATIVEGERAFADARSLSEAGIDTGADFAVVVGDTVATIRFDSKSRISVRTSSGTSYFDFNSGKGSFGRALTSALNSVEGLSASFTEDGRLRLQTSDAQSLRVADVANGWFDRSGSPLAALGLAAGTTHAMVTGTERVQIGTEQVQIGTETVVTGSIRVQVGERETVIGQQTVVTGITKRVEEGERVLVGLSQDDAPGVGALSVLDKLRGGGLPAGYVEALFGILEAYEAEPSEAEVRMSYAQNAESDPGEKPKPPSELRSPTEASA